MRTILAFSLVAAVVAPAAAQPGATPPGDAAPPASVAAPSVVAAPVPLERALVLHVPPGAAEAGRELRLVAVIDGFAAEPTLVVHHRTIGSGRPFAEVPFERSSAGGWFAIVPADAVARPGVEYFIAGTTTKGEPRLHFASDVDPHPVLVEVSALERQAEADRARMNGRLDVLSFDLHAHDFGNRYGNRDEFVRGELAWSHVFLGRLYGITMGHGFVQGRTPDSEAPGATSRYQAARYGFAELRLRPHDTVFVDLRAMLGVDRDGFERGGAGAITLGRPWRSNLSLGGELFEHMGPTAWMRLQWDTAPPLLMGASIVKTDLPDATLADGLYVKYDVAYALLDRLSVRAAVSYGSRDGRAHFGGGGGVSVGF